MTKLTIDPQIFKIGQIAFETGEEKTTNPYVDQLPVINSDSWLAGWNNAAFEAYKTKKKVLEFRAQQNPNENLAHDWLDLSEKFKDIDARANYHYCLICSRKEFDRWQMPQPENLQRFEDIADEPEFDWQSRKDVE